MSHVHVLPYDVATMAAEATSHIDGIRRSDPFAVFLLRFWQRVLDDPVRFAAYLEAAILAVYIPGGLVVSLANPDLVQPIWLDYMGPVFHLGWMTLFWAYARQPGLITYSFSCGAELLDDEARVGRWAQALSNRWLPIVFGGIVVAGIIVTDLHLFEEPEFYRRFYWREPIFFEVFFTPLIALLFYLGAMVCARQAIAGFILGRELMRFHPPQPLTHEAAAHYVREIRQIGSSITRQVAPWVIVGAWLLIWLVVAVLQSTYNNAILYGIVVGFVPTLILSLLFPLLALTIALRRIRKGQLKRIEEELEREYGRALDLLSDPKQSGDHNTKVRDLQELVRLTNTYFPVLPVGGVRLQAVAAGAVVQVLGFWMGLLLDFTSIISIAA